MQIEHPHEISDDRLAQLIDHQATAWDWEVPVIAAELLALRAGQRQRELARYTGPDVNPDSIE
jgi:hypothetical protein